MKKLKALSIMLVLVLVVALIQPTNASAAVKLNKSSITMYVGKTTTLKLSGTTKSATWTSSNKSVATVTSKGNVSAKSAGTATITAKVSSKKYTCKVTVKEAFNESDAKKKVTVEHIDTGRGIISIVTNNYTYPVSIDETIVYYDAGKSMISTSSNNAYCIAPGMSWAYKIYGPYDDDYNDVEYSTYKSNLKVEKPVFTDHSKDIELTSDMGSNGVVAEVTNTGKTNLDSVYVAIVYYKDGEAIFYDYTTADCGAAGSTDYVNLDFPYDSDTYDTILPDDYELYVTAFTY